MKRKQEFELEKVATRKLDAELNVDSTTVDAQVTAEMNADSAKVTAEVNADSAQVAAEISTQVIADSTELNAENIVDSTELQVIADSAEMNNESATKSTKSTAECPSTVTTTTIVDSDTVIETIQGVEEVVTTQGVQVVANPDKKIMWGNIGLHSKKDVIKYLNSIDLEHLKVKTAPKWDYCFIQFENEEQVLEGIKRLNGIEYKGKITYTTIPKPRQQSQQSNIVVDSSKDPQEQIADQVTPWWQIPYNEQLEKKNELVLKMLKIFEKRLSQYFPRKIKKKPTAIIKNQSYQERIKNMPSEVRALEQLAWIKEAKKECFGKICNIDSIVGSPVTLGYRNKVEFSFGKDLNGNIACGFLLGMYKQGVTTVLNPSFCKNVPEKAKLIANLLEEYCRESQIEVYDRELKTGFFRCCMVRILQSDQIMLLLQVQPLENIDIEVEKKKFVEFITTKIKIDSLFWQESSDKFNGITEDMPTQLLYGNPYITEKLMGQE